jgi:hypothetical protein
MINIKKFKIGPTIIVLAVFIPIALFLTFYLSLTKELQTSEPIVKHTADYQSPDHNNVLTIEKIDNGLGFGQGEMIDEFHITLNGELINTHGVKSESVFLYLHSESDSQIQTHPVWMNNDSVIIDVDKNIFSKIPPGKISFQFRGIHVKFVSRVF